MSLRSLLLLSILALIPASARATWTLTQVTNATGCSSPCVVTVTSTGAGHLLVAGILDVNTNTVITAVTAGACSATWTHAPNTAIGAGGDGSVDLYYCLNSTSGITSISITAGICGGSCIGVIWEASSSLGSIALDTGATPSGNQNDTVNCTSCSGTSLTLSGNNNFVVGLAACGGSCSGLTGTGWTNDLSNPSGDGVGHGITSGSQTAPTTWTQGPTNTLICNAAAFQESSGAVTPKCNPISLLGVGCK